MAALTIIKALFWGKNKEYECYEERRSLSLFWLIVTIIMAVAGVIVFILTEDMRLPMVLTDSWTILSAVIFVIGIVGAVLAFKKEKEEFQEGEVG